MPVPVSLNSATLTSNKPVRRPSRAPAATPPGVRAADDENQRLLDSHGENGNQLPVDELAGNSAEPNENPEAPPARLTEEWEPASYYTNQRTSDGHGPPRPAYFGHGTCEAALLPPLWFFFQWFPLRQIALGIDAVNLRRNVTPTGCKVCHILYTSLLPCGV
mmetsp:Transcript_20971/g.52774  ORF Transcript_20971/g.52774 Transcript_20971/m.52774 type:complete len:162 (-) Transcript_20971:376-861(-)